MEQTLVSEETLVSKISKLTIFEQFAQTIFVEYKQGVIEIENAFRESNILKFVRTEIAYELKNHRIISKKLNSSNILISDLTERSTISVDKSICRCVSSDLNKLFIQELNRFDLVVDSEFNLFSQNIIKKIINPNTNEDLINKFIEVGQGMGWAIIPYNLLSLFYSCPKLELQKEDNDRIIFHLGSIENIEIYVNPDDESGKIFFGNFNSIIILANKFMDIFENENGINYNFEYLFLEHGPIKSLQIK